MVPEIGDTGDGGGVDDVSGVVGLSGGISQLAKTGVPANLVK
jgi:hypothetical protein